MDASAVAAFRSADPDRYLATLYAPENKRGALHALFAFNAEIAGIRDRISQALPGEIRLQWWRDLIEAEDPNAATGHPVASALLTVINTHRLPRSAFANYLDARIFDLYDDPMPTRQDLEGYCGETAAALIQLAAMILEEDQAPRFAEMAGRAGCAQAITGLIRLLPLHRARGQCYVPGDILSAVGSSPQAMIAGNGDAERRAVSAMNALAREHLAAFEAGAAALPVSLRPAFLPLALTRAYLDKVSGNEADVLAHGADIAALRKHWLMLRRAMRGWS